MKRFSAPPSLPRQRQAATAAITTTNKSASIASDVHYFSATSASSSSSSHEDPSEMVLVRQQQQHQVQYHHHHHHHHPKHKPHHYHQYQHPQQRNQPQRQHSNYHHHHHRDPPPPPPPPPPPLPPQQLPHQKHHHQHVLNLNKHNHQPQPHHHRHDSSSSNSTSASGSDAATTRGKTEQTFESLFEQETHSDVTINVNTDEYVFHAHRLVLETTSKLFASLLARLDNKPDIEVTTRTSGTKHVLHVQEDAACGEVFSRFLYFLYSGSVWLHQDNVLPLYRLAHKYGVPPLLDHCLAYTLQILAKSCRAPSSPTNRTARPHHPHHNHHHNQHDHSKCISHNHTPANFVLTAPHAGSPPYAGTGFSLEAVCDLYEDEVFEGDVQQTAYRLLCCQFRRLVRSERWLDCRVDTVCRLIASDSCNVEENLILVSATDFMKRKSLSDKQQIEDILSLIRYPRLHRRVLYHLQKNGSFNNFPRIQQLMLGALMYHSFKDLPEAQHDFVGAQFRPRMSNNVSPNRRASMQVATVTECYQLDDDDDDHDDIDDYDDDDDPVISESAYSLDPSSPVTLIAARQSQV